MTNKSRINNTPTRQDATPNAHTDNLQAGLAEQAAPAGQVESRPASIPGLLECCRSSRRKVTTCNGTFK